MKDDRILPLTRIVAFLIIPFLVAAFFILYLQGDQTGERFAWQIDSRLTAAFMGAGYLGGAYFFLRVGLAEQWHRFAAGFPPVAVYTFFMLLASLLHWNNPFDPGHWPFQVWLVLYIVTPVLIPLLWRWNNTRDPHTPARGELKVPLRLRQAMAVAGGVILLAALFFFIFSTIAINVWPWPLTPLTARVMAGWQALLGTGALAIARENRWSSWPVALQSIAYWQSLNVVAFFRHRQEFGAAGLWNWFTLYTVVGLVALSLLLWWMRRERADPAGEVK
jgi:hypothetical protein